MRHILLSMDVPASVLHIAAPRRRQVTSAGSRNQAAVGQVVRSRPAVAQDHRRAERCKWLSPSACIVRPPPEADFSGVYQSKRGSLLPGREDSGSRQTRE